jgi:hypothetical protein
VGITYFQYNKNGGLTHTWGDTVYPVQYVFDTYGRMIQMHTYRTDDGFNNPTWPEEASGDITSWQYQEGTGLLLKKEDALTQSTDDTYTSAGRLHTRIWTRDNKTIMTTYTYNPAGDLTHIEYSDTTPDITFVYNRLGKKQSVIDGFGSRAFAYDPDTLNLVTEMLSGLYDEVIHTNYETTGIFKTRSYFYCY